MASLVMLFPGVEGDFFAVVVAFEAFFSVFSAVFVGVVLVGFAAGWVGSTDLVGLTDSVSSGGSVVAAAVVVAVGDAVGSVGSAG